jgi:hypothetical protein
MNDKNTRMIEETTKQWLPNNFPLLFYRLPDCSARNDKDDGVQSCTYQSRHTIFGTMHRLRQQKLSHCKPKMSVGRLSKQKVLTVDVVSTSLYGIGKVERGEDFWFSCNEEFC